MAELPKSIPCPECQTEVERLGWTGHVSRAAVQALHQDHRPMHPSQVGANHRKAARAAYDRWASQDPFATV